MPEELYTEKEYQSPLLKTLGDSSKLRIIDFFLDNSLFDFTKKEVIDALGMSKRTFYKINPKNPLVKLLKEYETQLSLQIAEVSL